MVKITPTGTANRGKGTLGNHRPRESSTTISKSIGWLNKEGILQQPISYSDVIGPLSALGDVAAGRLIAELSEKAGSINDPTRWLTAAAANSLGKGKGSFKSFAPPMSKGYTPMSKGFTPMSKGYAPMSTQAWSSPFSGGSWVETSPWVSKAIGQLNRSGKLKETINWSESIGVLSSVPESVAIGLIKELETKADVVKDPTSWLSAAASRYASGGKKWGVASSTISKKVGALNKSGKLQEPVSWTDVSGPLLLMDEDDAESLVTELEDKADEVKHPTNWLRIAAEKAVKKRKV